MSLLLDHDRYVQVALPPASVVSRIDPAAGKLIEKFNAYEGTLPERRDAEQLNELDRLRGEAVQALDAAFFETLGKQRAARRKQMRAALKTLVTAWSDEEADQGLDRWRGRLTSYAPVQAGGLSIQVGPAGYSQTVTGRQMLGRLAQMVGE